MAFKDTWKDKVNGVDDINADDINSIAQEAIALGEEVEKRIPANVTSLGQVRGIGDEIKFPIQDTSDKLKYFTWGKMRNAIAADTSAAIEESHKTALVEAAYAVSDSNGLYYAFLPEGMKADGVLALQSDLEGYYSKADKAQMVADVLEALPNASGVSF